MLHRWRSRGLRSPYPTSAAFAHRRLKNFQRSTMKQERLNNSLLMHFHKSITNTLDTMKTAKRFACANKGHFENLCRGMRMA